MAEHQDDFTHLDSDSPLDREEQSVAEYISSLRSSPRMGHMVACHRDLPSRQASTAPNRRPWPRAVQGLLAAAGIEDLYSHQARATDLIRAGRNVVVATPTASGKTFVYNLPVIERHLQDPDSKSLYLFPLKALAQDQLRTFTELTSLWPSDARPDAAVYDGDTSQWFRKKIRENPPAVLMSNPEMIHLSMLPYHDRWAAFLAGLSHIVVDEVHTYRGVLGSHMAQVFRRLQRVCRYYGADPSFVFCSATVGNPGELARQLTGVDVEEVTESGAPQGTRHFLFLDPDDSPSQAAIQLLQSALHRGLRTIVYTQSRRMTELISLWASERAGKFRDRISAYRAGFLPEERREIEARMTSGELLAVVSTSALELGIDIGSLDLCILVGYPGTVMQTLQRGGRVGRALRDSAVILIAGEDALDQYFVRNPQDFFERPPETAVLNPHNPAILDRHLECAAAELPFRPDEPWLQDAQVANALTRLERQATLLRNAEGTEVFAARKRPHRDISLRGSGRQYSITVGPKPKDSDQADLLGGVTLGQIDEARAFAETHPGAVYLHKGESYVVDDLDTATGTVRVVPAKVDYFTRKRGTKTTEILKTHEQRTVWGTRVFRGRLRVTETVTGYEKRRVRGNRLMTVVPLDLPPLVFETDGLWFEIPLAVQREAEDELYHFMGGIHALEHAAIGILPLLVMTDRNDLGGISTPMHPQVGLPAVFIYDGVPGGVGLSTLAFTKAEELFERTRTAIASCPCELGCPSCVHSPKCGSGNRPIDKAAALILLRKLADAPAPPPAEHLPSIADIAPQDHLSESISPYAEKDASGSKSPSISKDSPSASSCHPRIDDPAAPTATPVFPSTTAGVTAMPERPDNYAVLDLETQLSAQEVGGWNRADLMRVSCCVVYANRDDVFHVYLEDDMPRLMDDLQTFDRIVGFNINRFDYQVLSAYTAANLRTLPTLDILDEVKRRLSYRLSLDHLAQATLNAAKSADGLQALKWWKEGRLDDIIAYCKQDVAVTRDLYRYGMDHGHLLFTNKAKRKVRLPVDW